MQARSSVPERNKVRLGSFHTSVNNDYHYHFAKKLYVSVFPKSQRRKLQHQRNVIEFFVHETFFCFEYTLQWRKEQRCLINTASFAQLKNKGSCYSKVSFFEYTLQWRTEQLCFIDTASFAQLKKDCSIKERVHAIQSKLIKKRTAYYSIQTFEIVATKLVFWCLFTYFETKHTIRYLPSENSLAPSIFTILFFNIATSCNGGRNEQLFA